MTEQMRKIARAEAEDAVRDHSISVLGYDPAKPGADQPPREILAWARAKQRREEARTKYLGVVMLTALGAAVTLMVNLFGGKIGKLLGL